MRDNTGIGEVVDSCKSLLCHCQRSGKHLGEDSHRVRDIDNTLVLNNLGDEVTVEEVVRDGHTNAQYETIGVALEHLLHVSLGLTVEGLCEVRNRIFFEPNTRSKRMSLVVFEDAPGGVDGAVDSSLIGAISDIEGSDDVGADSGGLVILAPVDVWTACDSCCHENMGRLDFIELLSEALAVLNSCVSKEALDPFYSFGIKRHQLFGIKLSVTPSYLRYIWFSLFTSRSQSIFGPLLHYNVPSSLRRSAMRPPIHPVFPP